MGASVGKVPWIGHCVSELTVCSLSAMLIGSSEGLRPYNGKEEQASPLLPPYPVHSLLRPVQCSALSMYRRACQD